MQETSVKSWANAPTLDSGALAAGLVLTQGVAFGGLNAVRRVEVSIDPGKSWREARLVGPDLCKCSWRQFVLPVYQARRQPRGNRNAQWPGPERSYNGTLSEEQIAALALYVSKGSCGAK